MTKSFEKSWLPQSLVTSFGVTLPFIEFAVGLLLLIGFKTGWANIAGAVLMVALLFGCSTIENWEAMGIQMIYILFFYFLISQQDQNSFSIDNLLKH